MYHFITETNISAVVIHSIHAKETWTCENINVHNKVWRLRLGWICESKMVRFQLGQPSGYIKYICFFLLWNSHSKDIHFFSYLWVWHLLEWWIVFLGRKNQRTKRKLFVMCSAPLSVLKLIWALRLITSLAITNIFQKTRNVSHQDIKVVEEC